MSTTQEIQEAIVRLSVSEKEELWDWMRRAAETDWERWDRQIDQDSADGKLDKLIEQADRDFEDGKCRPWP